MTSATTDQVPSGQVPTDQVPSGPGPGPGPSPVSAPAPTPGPDGPELLTVPPGAVASGWLTEQRQDIEARIGASGAVLLRGTGIRSAADLADVAAALGIEPMVERERFAPRAELGRGVHSSSEWPADEPMCMHHELSYAEQVPALLLFGCLVAPAEGGRTEVADSQRVLEALPSELVDRFSREGWLLTRSYHEVGVPWTEAFGTEDRAQVDAYCAAAGLDHEWLPDGRLRTRQRRAAVLRHPGTGRPVWFNQVAFLNERTLDPAIREYLVDVYGPSGLPFNTAYGEGGELSDDTVETINAAYRDASAGLPWQAGDVLLVDNLRMAHSRDPFRGEREIVVLLGNPVRLEGHVLP